MANFSSLNLLFVVLFSIAAAEGAVVASTPSAAVKGAYYPSWLLSSLPLSSIETKLFTHILYAFLSPSNSTYKFEVSDSTAPLLLNFTAALHGKDPPVKTLISIDGASDGPTLFPTIASHGNGNSNGNGHLILFLSRHDFVNLSPFGDLSLSDWVLVEDDKEHGVYYLHEKFAADELNYLEN
ncbi:hypothetical protein NL676_008155 [Syzygium grande]|nr:hypothetical protein NL676_008155 [Syzygium grande]